MLNKRRKLREALVINHKVLFGKISQQGGGEGGSYFQKLFIFSQQVTYPIILCKHRYQKNVRPIGGGLGVPQALRNIRPKYKGNGHKIGHKFHLAITFYVMQ